MHIRTYIRSLGKFLQQMFNKKLNISLFVRRRSKYVHLGLDIPLLQRLKRLKIEKENRDPKYLFIFPRLIHTTRRTYDYIILEEKYI